MSARPQNTMILALATALLMTSCAKGVGEGSPGIGGGDGEAGRGPLPAAAPTDLQEAALQAARVVDHKVEYSLETASRRGRLTYALSGDRTSWRLEQNVLDQRAGRGRSAVVLSAYVLEMPTETVYCLLENVWRCFEGESTPGSAPAFFDRRSFEFIAAAAPSIPPESYKRTEARPAGYSASCFDITPQPHLFEGPGDEDGAGEGPVPPPAPVDGVDAEALDALRNSLVLEVLYRGGTLCLGTGILLKMVILDEELFAISAERVSLPVDSDFTPPVPPEPVGTPSPFPSVIQAT